MIYEETILGKVPSKSNCYKIISIAGHASLCKQNVLKQYEKTFFMQCKCRGIMLKQPFKLTADVYHENNRPDLDNAFKIVLDCLQTCKVIENDRYCVEIHARKLIDKNNPRIVLKIEELL